MDNGGTRPDIDIVAAHVQEFADRLFQDIHLQSGLKLTALVFGGMGSVDNFWGEQSRLLPYYFVKDWLLGSCVPVTRAALRRSQPYTDLLDVDFNFDLHEGSAPWEQMAGRACGYA